MNRRLFLGALAGAGIARAVEPTRLAEIERLVSIEMSKQQIPGMSIAIWRGTEPLWTQGYGMADLENFVPARAGTLFRTASIAKPMTAVAILQLHERGLVELDAPVQKYVKFPEKPWPVTPRLLMGHLGGVRHYRADGSDLNNVRHFGSSLEALRVFQDDALIAEPGTKYTYTTYGYVLLGAIVEQTSGLPLIDYFNAHVFRPAGMTSTRADDHYAVTQGRSRWYSKRNDGTVVNSPFLDTSVKVAGGGLVSTSADLVRFARAVDDGRLLKPETVQLMWTPMRMKDGRSLSYGLGWDLQDLKGRRKVGHTGGQAGCSSVLRLLPESDVALAMMFNLDGVQFNPLADAILEML